MNAAPAAHDLTAEHIFTSPLSQPMPAATKAARQVIKGETPDDELANTEAAMAASFALDHGEKLAYDYRRRAWMVCSRGVWREDGSGEALRTLQGWAETRVFELVGAATNRRDMDAMRTAARRALSARTLKNLLELAASQAALADVGDTWDLNPWILMARDGTAIDLRDGRARPATAADRVTLACGVTYDSAASCETFRAFIHEICDGDDALVSLIQKAAGYSATGDTREQKFIIGHGSNGKSTLLEILAYVLGDYAAVIPFSVLAKERDVRSVPVEIARLPGRRFVRASELRGGVALDEGRIKALCGSDVIMARGLYQAPFEFTPVGKLWLACNKLPRVDDRSHAFWRRAVVIPFRRTFDGAARDNDLPAKLRAEGPGILNWIIEGALAWQRDGLPHVAAVEVARDDWRVSQDVIGQWAAGALVAHPDGRLKARDAYHAFCAWAASEGLSDRERPGSRSFGEWMGENYDKKATKSCNVYEAMAVEGGGLEADPVNPPTRAQGETFPNTLNTLHPPPQGGVRV